MDDLDSKILGLLRKNARMTVKEIAGQVSLTSPAVSERIRRMEQRGIIAGYTAKLGPAVEQGKIGAIVSISVSPKDRDKFHKMLQEEPSVLRSYHVTGMYSHMVRVCCNDIADLEHLLSIMQKLGQTSTQIVLSMEEGAGLY